MPVEIEVRKGRGWLIETYDGCCVVPDDDVDVEPFEGDPDSELYSLWLQHALSQFEEHCDGPIIEISDYPIGGWLGRVVVSEHIRGRWNLYETRSEAEADLIGDLP